MNTVERATLTRDAVVAATRALIVDESLDAVSLRRIGASLSVTAPALYAHVTDKRDLLRGVAEFELTQLMSRFQGITDPDPVVRLRQFSRVYIDYAVENRELFKTIFLFPPDLAIGVPTGEELPVANASLRAAVARHRRGDRDRCVQADRSGDGQPRSVDRDAWLR